MWCNLHLAKECNIEVLCKVEELSKLALYILRSQLLMGGEIHSKVSCKVVGYSNTAWCNLIRQVGYSTSALNKSELGIRPSG